jgi:hypothetical protein
VIPANERAREALDGPPQRTRAAPRSPTRIAKRCGVQPLRARLQKTQTLHNGEDKTSSLFVSVGEPQCGTDAAGAVTGNELGDLSMRYSYALVLGIGLCGVPAIGRAAPAGDRASQLAAPVQASGRATQRHGADGLSAASDARAADNADDRARYAEREAQSGKAQAYRGGDTVVIGTSAAVVVLAIILVVILL